MSMLSWSKELTMLVVTIVVMCLHTNTVAVNGFYLPGVAPHNFQKGEQVDLKVNKLR